MGIDLPGQEPVVISRRRLRPGEEFAYEVSAEVILDNGRFIRPIVTGPFQPTSRIEYDDPGDDR